MRPKLLLAALALFSPPAHAQVSDWRPVGFIGQSENQYIIVYLDVARVRSTGATTREMTVANVYPVTQTMTTGDRYDWQEATYAVDCTAMTGSRVRASAHIAPVPFIVSNKAGSPLPMGVGDLPLSRAAKSACSGKFATLWQPTPALVPHARERFAMRGALQEAMTSSGWYWLGAEGKVPARTSVFVHRPSIVTEPSGSRLVTTVTITEAPAGAAPGYPTFYANRVRIDCRMRTKTALYAEMHGGRVVLDKDAVGTFPGAQPQTMASGLFAAPYVPVCTGDWSKTRAIQEMPARFREIAFTLK